MKNTTAILMIAFLATMLFCSLAAADVETYVSGASIRVSMISQDPDPVEPGDYVELRWMVTNYGSTPLQDVEFKLEADYPVQLLGSDDGIRELGTIQGHQKGEEGVVLHYRVRIDQDASEGTNKIYLKYRYQGMEWTKLDYFEVRVRSVDAAVVIDSITMEPERIPAGNDGKLTISLKNLADSRMENINVKLDLTLTTIPQPTTVTEAAILYDALPFAPIDSASEKRIPAIKPGESKDVIFDLMVYPDAISRVYKLPVIINYKDELDNEYEKDDIIGIVVGSEPDIYVVIDSSDLLAGRKSGKVSFKFVNRGVTDIKFLDVMLSESDEFEIVSAKEEYIGNIDSDDFESVDFTVYLKNNVDSKNSHTLEFPLHLEFKDANNIPYSKDVKLEHKIYTAEEKGQASGSSAVIIVVAIVIIIAVWIVYRQIMKRRRKKQAIASKS